MEEKKNKRNGVEFIDNISVSRASDTLFIDTSHWKRTLDVISSMRVLNNTSTSYILNACFVHAKVNFHKVVLSILRFLLTRSIAITDTLIRFSGNICSPLT